MAGTARKTEEPRSAEEPKNKPQLRVSPATALTHHELIIDFLDGEPAGDWHLEYRERLQMQFVSALMQLGERHCAEERHAQAADVKERRSWPVASSCM